MVGTIVTVGLMILAFIGMIISAKIQKTNPNAKILAFVCLLVVLGCAIKFMADTGVFGGETSEDRENRESYFRYRSSTAKRLGDTYAAAYKGKKVVVIAANGTNFNTPDNMVFPNEIKEAFAGANVVVTGLDYKPSDTPSGIEETMNPKLYEKLFSAQKDAALIIFTISLPPDSPNFKNLSIWNNSKGPKLVFIDTNPSKFIGKMLLKDRVLAVVVQKPNLTLKDYEKLAPKDLKKAFDERYLLISKENAAQLSKTYKNLFY